MPKDRYPSQLYIYSDDQKIPVFLESNRKAVRRSERSGGNPEARTIQIYDTAFEIVEDADNKSWIASSDMCLPVYRRFGSTIDSVATGAIMVSLKSPESETKLRLLCSELKIPIVEKHQYIPNLFVLRGSRENPARHLQNIESLDAADFVLRAAPEIVSAVSRR